MPKECEKTREQLPEYADGSLVGAPKLAVERHLETCARCTAELAELRTVIAAARAVPQEDPPEHLADRVTRAVRSQAPAAPSRFWVRLAVPAAVLTGVVAVTFALRMPAQTRRSMLPATEQKGMAALERESARSEFAPGVGSVQLSPVPQAETDTRADGVFFAEDEARAARQPLSGLGIRKEEGLRGGITGRAGRGGPRRAEGELDYAPPPDEPAPRVDSLSAGRHMGEEQAETVPDTYHDRDQVAIADRVSAEQKAATAGPPRPRQEVEGLTLTAESAAVALPPRPPVSTTITVVRAGSGGHLLALQLSGAAPVRELSLQVGDTPATTHQWVGDPGRPALIPLPTERIGTGPAAIPVTVMTDKGEGEYVLFMPTLARLGESAPQAPAGRWQETEVKQALFDLSMFTGLVILAEEPLTTQLSGDIPAGTPADALQRLAAEAGFEVHREGTLAYTLTHLR
ncbi:MAG: zf-HC2 domain-containing protein [Armatimonadetes bacterium]|nr:zf-HC2 domain-containing protein [Armatimonadota bacterium]